MKNEKITSNITIKIDSTCLDKNNNYFNHTITLQEKNKELFHLNVRHDGNACLTIKQEIIDADKLQQYEYCIGTINNIKSFNKSIKSLIDKTTNNTERKNSETVIKQLITELLVNQMGLTS